MLQSFYRRLVLVVVIAVIQFLVVDHQYGESFTYSNPSSCFSCSQRNSRTTGCSTCEGVGSDVRLRLGVNDEVKTVVDNNNNDNNTVNQKYYDDLLTWIQQSCHPDSYVNDKIQLRPSTNGVGYGAFVTDQVEKNEILFRIPRIACITLENVYNDIYYGKSYKALVDKVGPGGSTVVLAGYLAMERLKQLYTIEGSTYSAYLNTLPWERNGIIHQQEHILYWTDQEIETLLQGTMCYDEAIEIRQEVALAITVLERIFAKPIPQRTFKLPWDNEDLSPPPPPDIPLDQLPAMVKAAFVCILTRSFQYNTTTGDNDDEDEDDTEKFVPLLDMLQHSESPNISHVMLKEQNYNVEVRSRISLKSGDELYNQYQTELGMNSMPYHRFFTRFGFVPGIMNEPIIHLLRDKSSIFVAQKAEV